MKKEMLYLLMLGIITGTLSASVYTRTYGWGGSDYPSLFGYFLPGAFFGVGVALTYILKTNNSTRDKAIFALIVPILCSLCFVVAWWTTFFLTFYPGISAITTFLAFYAGSSTIAAALPGGLLATAIMMLGLKTLTHAYTGREAGLMSLYGGLLGSLGFIIFYMLGGFSEPNHATEQWIFFFNIWQGIMMVLVGLPLLKTKN